MTRQSSKIQSLPVEILVEILSNLDNRTLLATQRVSGRWRDIVTTAPTLQQKLFLGPIATHNSNNLVTSNPLLESIFPPYLRQLAPGPGFSVLKNYFYYPYYPYEFKVRIPTRRESGRAVAVNAEVLNRLSAISYKKREVQAGKAASLEWFRSRAEAFFRPEASWRRMFAVQPPAKLYLVKEKFCDRYQQLIVRRRRLDWKGDETPGTRFRLGELYDLLIHLNEEKRVDWGGICCVDWHVSPPSREREGSKGAGWEGRLPLDGDGEWCPAVIVRQMDECCPTFGDRPRQTEGLKIADFDCKLSFYDGKKEQHLFHLRYTFEDDFDSESEIEDEE